MKNPIDGKNIVIIGSGVGGLSAGIILSLLQYNVTIVEKKPVAGGLMRSYRSSGIECPVGVHYVGALGDDEPLGKMFRFMGIVVADLFERMGQDGVIDRYVFDNFTFDLPVGIDAYEKNLRTAFPEDAAAIDVIMNDLRDIALRMRETSFIINQGDPFQTIEYFNPMGEYLEKLNASIGLWDVLAVPSMLIGVRMPECPVIFHNMILAGYLFSCWRLKENGTRMAEVFARRFKDLGGKIILKNGVAKILLKEQKVTGVRLESGEEISSDAVVATIHPKALLPLLEPQALRSSFQERILNLKETDGVIVVQVSVDAEAHQELTHNIYRLHTDQNGMIYDGMFYQLRRSNKAGANLLSIITKSLYSEWSQWERTKTGKRGPEYENKKLAIANELLKNAEDVFGNLKNARIVDVFTPLTLRDYVDCPEGSCYGVLRSAGQLLKIASMNNIPLSGLCLAGQNAVSTGVLGTILGSFNAVRQIAGVERLTQELQKAI